MALLDNEEFDFFCTLVEKNAGVRPPPRKRGALAQKLDPLLEQLGLSTASELIRLLRASGEDSSIYKQTLESMLSVDGKFFKGYGAYRHLRQVAIPEIMANNQEHKTINIWSAGCGTGEEPYSISVTLRAAFPELKDWNVKIYGTDHTKHLLEKAKTGLYTNHDIARGVPEEMIERSFERLGKRWMVKPEDREWVEFRHINLINEWHDLPTFDVVFLRDVLLYFPVQAKNKILERLLGHLTPTSFVFLGPREKPPGNLHMVLRLVTDPKVNCYQVSEEFNELIDDDGAQLYEEINEVISTNDYEPESVSAALDAQLENQEAEELAAKPKPKSAPHAPTKEAIQAAHPNHAQGDPHESEEQQGDKKGARRPSLAQIKKAQEKNEPQPEQNLKDVTEVTKLTLSSDDNSRVKSVISNIYLFQDMPKGLIDEISKRLELFQFPDGDRLIRQGQQGEAFFILFKGDADVVISRGLLRRGQTVANLKAGDIFGEMSIIMDQPCNADIVAAGSVQVLAASRKLFEWLVREHEVFANRVHEIITERSADTAVKLKMKKAAQENPAAPEEEEEAPSPAGKKRAPSAQAIAAAKSGTSTSQSLTAPTKPKFQAPPHNQVFETVTKLPMTKEDFHHLHHLVRDIYLFRDLKAGELETICTKLQLYGFPDHHPVIKHGDDGSAFYIIYSGNVRVMGKGNFFRKGPELAVLGPGEVFGEMSLILERPCSANVVADGNLRAFMVSRALFEYLFDENSSFAATVNAIAVQRRADTAIKMS